ncbi:hypothetical protein [Bacillus sp. Marseille-P3661]|uniref:hypothetical protein n=1 Tax=Bacillus sp. Marseille-P3661 TaxID=1936234 RepID=UPI000C81488C|nr:hypothetical protein [Bacillus sp. Marseille-P3661]
METFLEIIREIAKGIVRESAAYIFRKNVIDSKKTTPLRSKQKGGSHKNINNIDNNLIFSEIQRGQRIMVN